MTVSVQVRDPNATELPIYKPVTGTEIPADNEFAMDVYIKGATEDFIAEFDINVTPVEEIIWENILEVTGLTMAQAENLFDKDISTTVLLQPLTTWVFTLDKSYRVKTFKVLDGGAGQEGYYVNSELVQYVLTAPDGNTYTGNFSDDPQPIYIEDEIIEIQLINTSNDVVFEIAEIIGELFFDRQVYAPERRPMNNTELGEITAEDITYAEFGPAGGAMTPLTRGEINNLFDKDATTYFTLTAGYTLYMYIKKPFNIRRLFATQYVVDTWWNIAAQVDIGIFDLYEIEHLYPCEGEAGEYGVNVAFFNDMMTMFNITNVGDVDIDIAEIIGEKFIPVESNTRVFEPMPVKEGQWLVPDDIRDVIEYDDDGEIRRLSRPEIESIFNKNGWNAPQLHPILDATGEDNIYWRVLFNTAQRIKEIKTLSSNHGELPDYPLFAVPIEYIWSPIDQSKVDITQNDYVVFIDNEISYFDMVNLTELNINVYQIQIEKFNDQRTHIQLDGETYYVFDDGVATPEDEPTNGLAFTLTNGFIEFPWAFIPQSWDLKNDEDDQGGYIEWSWNGTDVAGRLLAGEAFHEVTHKRSVYLRGESGGELYRVWAR